MSIFDKIKGISVASGFKAQIKAPLDARLVVDNIADRNSLISENAAYEGMKVYVKSDKKTYTLKGSTVSDWKEDTDDDYSAARLQYYGDKDVIPTSQNDFQWNISNGVANVIGYTGSDTAIIIPYEYIDDQTGDIYLVTGIESQAFEDCANLTSVVIPRSVTNIDGAFYGCANLTSIDIPDSVIHIGTGTFLNCTSLIDVSIPDSVTDIDPAAFYYCTSLVKIVIPNSVTSIDSAAFNGCTSLTSIVIPNSVIDIDNSVFIGCDNLTIVCEQGSYAETFAKENNIPYAYSVIDGTALDDLSKDISFILDHTRVITFNNIRWTPGSISNYDGSIWDSTTHLRTINVDMIQYHSPFFILNPNSLPIMPVEYTSNGTFVRGYNESKGPILMINPSSNGGYFRLQYYADRTLIDEDYNVVKSLSFAVPTDDYYKRQISLLMPSLSMFPTFGVIGDSYASGVVALDNDFEDRYPQSWGQMLAKKTGTKCTNFSHTGLTTGTWLTHEKGLAKLQAEDAKYIYYLCLGINDHNAGMSYLGTSTDIGTNADTFYGNYSKIITAIQTKAPNAKIVMFTITRCSSGKKDVVDAFNTAIINIANYYHIPYIVQDDDYLLQTDWYSGQLYRGHPRTYTYASMANAYERLIQKCIYDNYNYFANYQITTEHSDVDDDLDEITILQRNVTEIKNAEKYYGDGSISYTPVSQFEWSIGTPTVIAEYKGTDANVVVPYEYKLNGTVRPVVSIAADGFLGKSTLTSVVIPLGITGIGDECFKNCINLTNINIPNTVTYIGEECFKNCQSLTSLTIPDSVIEIGDNAFVGCSQDFVIICTQGSYVEQYAFENNIPVKYDIVDLKPINDRIDGLDIEEKIFSDQFTEENNVMFIGNTKEDVIIPLSDIINVNSYDVKLPTGEATITMKGSMWATRYATTDLSITASGARLLGSVEGILKSYDEDDVLIDSISIPSLFEGEYVDADGCLYSWGNSDVPATSALPNSTKDSTTVAKYPNELVNAYSISYRDAETYTIYGGAQGNNYTASDGVNVITRKLQTFKNDTWSNINDIKFPSSDDEIPLIYPTFCTVNNNTLTYHKIYPMSYSEFITTTKLDVCAVRYVSGAWTLYFRLNPDYGWTTTSDIGDGTNKHWFAAIKSSANLTQSVNPIDNKINIVAGGKLVFEPIADNNPISDNPTGTFITENYKLIDDAAYTKYELGTSYVGRDTLLRHTIKASVSTGLGGNEAPNGIINTSNNYDAAIGTKILLSIGLKSIETEELFGYGNARDEQTEISLIRRISEPITLEPEWFVAMTALDEIGGLYEYHIPINKLPQTPKEVATDEVANILNPAFGVKSDDAISQDSTFAYNKYNISFSYDEDDGYVVVKFKNQSYTRLGISENSFKNAVKKCGFYIRYELAEPEITHEVDKLFIHSGDIVNASVVNGYNQAGDISLYTATNIEGSVSAIESITDNVDALNYRVKNIEISASKIGVADGVTDDYEAIQAFINKAETANPNMQVTVTIPEGVYAISQPLQIKNSNLKLIGQGRVILKLLGRIHGIELANSVHDVTIDNFEIQMPDVANLTTPETLGQCCGIYAGANNFGVYRVNIANITVIGTHRLRTGNIDKSIGIFYGSVPKTSGYAYFGIMDNINVFNVYEGIHLRASSVDVKDVTWDESAFLTPLIESNTYEYQTCGVGIGVNLDTSTECHVRMHGQSLGDYERSMNWINQEITNGKTIAQLKTLFPHLVTRYGINGSLVPTHIMFDENDLDAFTPVDISTFESNNVYKLYYIKENDEYIPVNIHDTPTPVSGVTYYEYIGKYKRIGVSKYACKCNGTYNTIDGYSYDGQRLQESYFYFGTGSRGNKYTLPHSSELNRIDENAYNETVESSWCYINAVKFIDDNGFANIITNNDIFDVRPFVGEMYLHGCDENNTQYSYSQPHGIQDNALAFVDKWDNQSVIQCYQKLSDGTLSYIYDSTGINQGIISDMSLLFDINGNSNNNFSDGITLGMPTSEEPIYLDILWNSVKSLRYLSKLIIKWNNYIPKDFNIYFHHPTDGANYSIYDVIYGRDNKSPQLEFCGTNYHIYDNRKYQQMIQSINGIRIVIYSANKCKFDNFKLTTDTEIVDGKTYYMIDNGDYIIVNDPTSTDLSLYYELINGNNTFDNSEGNVGISYIYAVDGSMGGKSYLGRGGGELYGDLNMKNNYIKIGSVDQLPVASSAYRGKEIILKDDINGDKIYVCIYKGNNVYKWDDITPTTINTSNETSVQLTMLNNVENRYGELTDLEIIIPQTLEDDYISSVIFTSGSTPTTLIYPDNPNIKIKNVRLISGKFVPEANTRYGLSFSYDGQYIIVNIEVTDI